MCLAIPAQIQSIQENEFRMGVVSFGGTRKQVCLALVPEATIGDYVIVHVGFAISKVDETAAQDMLSVLKEMSETGSEKVAPS